MTDFIDVYNNHAEEYDFLVKSEDYQDNLWKKLKEITSFDKKTVVELGAGTGRLTARIVRMAEHVYAFDRAKHMIDKAKINLSEFPEDKFTLQVAENTNIPLSEGIADIVIEGWSFGHMIIDDFSNFQKVIKKVISECFRLLKKDGILIIIETLGTCKENPMVPDEKLNEFYNYLENKLNFSHAWVRTDYKFKSIDEAKQSFGFFFGNEAVEYIEKKSSNIIPECTGIWWLKKS